MASRTKATSIIAMKGCPFTRKTEFANLIARSLKCPLLSLDEVLNTLQPSPAPCSTSCPILQRDLGFRIICDLAKLNVGGIFDNVVIDSPLSSQSHLDHLITVAKSVGQTRVVIIECKPKNTCSWRLKFERYLNFNPYYSQLWFKAKDWDEVEKAIQYGDVEIPEDDRVSKLVLDPFRDGPQFNHSYVIIPSVPILLMEAVEYMITCEKGDGRTIVAYDQWRKSIYLPSPMKKQSLCRRGHCVSDYSEHGLQQEDNCMACDKQVKGAAYTCKYCPLVLHKDCAESFDKSKSRSRGDPDCRSACKSCEEDGKSFSEDCASCLFKTHLRCGKLPTVIRHDCEEHFLSILLSPVQDEVCRCAACGEAGVSTIFYSCKKCNLVYHYECLSEVPSRIEHVHGLHHHHMKLRFTTEEEAEGYVCLECLEMRDPQLWFYTCDECEYEAHLYCVLPVKDKMPLSSMPNLSFVRKERLPHYVLQLRKHSQ